MSHKIAAMMLRYGINPQQSSAQVETQGSKLPFEILGGNPSYINMLDALRGWQLVRELRTRLGVPSAASFKHVNPAGVGLGSGTLTDQFYRMHFLETVVNSPLAVAYLRARHCDRISSYGDFAALSDHVDLETAEVLRGVASDGVIAPGFSKEALELLKNKKGGKYLVIAMDPDFEPAGADLRTEYGLTLAQPIDRTAVPDLAPSMIVSKKTEVDSRAETALLFAAIVARYTQSNAVVIASDNQTLGIGAGQQSRISATRLACANCDNYRLLSHPSILNMEFHQSLKRIEKINLVDAFLRFSEISSAEVEQLNTGILNFPVELSVIRTRDHLVPVDGPLCMASDAFIPFRDNVDRAAMSGVTHIVQTGGSLRDEDVTRAADDYGMVMVHNESRYFLH